VKRISRPNRYPKRLQFEPLESRQLLDASALRINEFLAVNDQILQDEDGDFSDWLELYNPTSEPIDVEGWSLTDDPEHMARWTLPAIAIPAGGFQTIFASGKNRTDPASELHTNFQLDGDGEYLALLDPAGSVVEEFRPAFPEQRPNISYGVPVGQRLLVDAQTELAYHVPTAGDSQIGAAWTKTEFDDSQWSRGRGTLGFDLRAIVPNIGFEDRNLSRWESVGNVRVIADRFGVGPTEGARQAVLSSQDTSTTRRGAERLLGLERFALNEVGNGRVIRASALARTFQVQAGDEITFDWNFLTSDNSNRDFAFVTLNPQLGVQKLADVDQRLRPSSSDLARETGYRTFRQVFQEAATVTLGIGIAQVEDNTGESVLLVDNVTMAGRGDRGSRYTEHIDVDIGRALRGVNSSIWTRQQFEVPDTSEISSLVLHVRYDDGIAAFLNGVPIAQRNAPADLAWSSYAPRRGSVIDAVRFQSIPIPLDSQALIQGRNVLAVQGLNWHTADDDFLVGVELVGIVKLGEEALFLTSPTPGAANVSDSFELVADVQFSVERGFYYAPFLVTLTSDTPGAAIRYTTDGSAPTQDHGLDYRGPLSIDGTTVLRAAAFKGRSISRRIGTQSYVFIEDVLKQSTRSAVEAGLPSFWSVTNQTPLFADYEMDQRVIGPGGTDAFQGVYTATVRDDLLAIPTLSLVLDAGDLFGERGIYTNVEQRDSQWERPTSVELVFPDGRHGFQIDAGLRIQGGVSRFIANKQSFRLTFRQQYGATRLQFPLFGQDAAAEFDSITLRSSSGEHIGQPYFGIHYIRDEFMRRSELAAGNASSHGTFVHLYINGLYWGLYNPVERLDAQFGANYFGGSKDEYDVLDAGSIDQQGVTVVSGSRDSWDELVRLAREVGDAQTQEQKTAAYYRLLGRNPDGSENTLLESYLDVDNFINYLILHLYGRNDDWPHRNYYMLRRRGPESTGFKFPVWDAEFTLDAGIGHRLDDLVALPRELQGPTVILQPLLSSEAFRVRFSDLVQKHFSPGGALYVNPDRPDWDPEHPENNVPAARYADLAAQIEDAIVPETARWGDEIGHFYNILFDDVPDDNLNFLFSVFTRDEVWRPVVEANLREFFPTRSVEMLAELRAADAYRDAPLIRPPGGGQVSADTRITMEAPQAAAIYFTLDGTDPRAPDGTISPRATKYTEPIAVTARTVLSARALTGEKWTAINQATFRIDSVAADSTNLRITELNYNPHVPLARLGETDTDNNQFEFIELMNVASGPIDLAGVRFVQGFGGGIEFTFGDQILRPQHRVVVPKDRAAFVSRYGPDAPLARGLGDNPGQWVYGGRLSNQGETIRLLDAQGATIQQFTFDDSGAWPGRADGNGSSLEVIDVMADANDPANWRASSEFGGSPGTEGRGPHERVVINEVLANSDDPQLDLIELYNMTDQPIDMTHWYLSDSSDDFFKFQLTSTTVIGARSYLVFDQNQLGFALDSVEGDDVFLIEADARGRPIAFVDRVQFGPSASGVTLGRWPNGSGRLFPMRRLTPGLSNAGPQIGDVIVSEIVYQAADRDGRGMGRSEDSGFEFIELYNRLTTPVDISGWRLEGDIEFQFASSSVMAPSQPLVIVRFDPAADLEARAAFRAVYGLSDFVQLAGPYSGQLDNAQGTVRLTRPALSVFVLVDEVRYDSTAPWPTGLALSGESLARVSPFAFGSFATSWRGAAATPGTVKFSSGDFNNDSAVNQQDIVLLCDAVRHAIPDRRFDLNRDARVDIADFRFLIGDIFGTSAGDANLDGRFDRDDLVHVLAADHFQDDVAGNATWATGDWNCDGEFDRLDIVAALESGTYVR
jgi:hypothetical protein